MAEFRKKVDSSWKKKAEQEKRALAQKSRHTTEAENAQDEPEAMFLDLVRPLAMQAQLALGLMPDPMTRERRTDPAAAQHSIALLEVLRDKTVGNLDPDEATTLQTLISELKMFYMRVAG